MSTESNIKNNIKFKIEGILSATIINKDKDKDTFSFVPIVHYFLLKEYIQIDLVSNLIIYKKTHTHTHFILAIFLIYSLLIHTRCLICIRNIIGEY